jgi:hypothetical protein
MSAPSTGEQTSGVAIASLVLGLVSVVLGLFVGFVFGLAGPAAIVLGKHAQRRVDESGGALKGRGLATAGFTLGVVGTVVLVLQVAFLIYLVASGKGLDVSDNLRGAGS